MQKALSILDMLTTHARDIKEGLGQEGWSVLAEKIRSYATSFENLTDEAALINAANQLLGLFMTDETAREILTRPVEGDRRASGQRHSLDRRDPSKVIRLETIANRFYLLCSQIDEVAETSSDEIAAKASRDQSDIQSPATSSKKGSKGG